MMRVCDYTIYVLLVAYNRTLQFRDNDGEPSGTAQEPNHQHEIRVVGPIYAGGKEQVLAWAHGHYKHVPRIGDVTVTLVKCLELDGVVINHL